MQRHTQSALYRVTTVLVLLRCEHFATKRIETFSEAQFPPVYGKMWRLSRDEKLEKMRGIITGMMIHDCEKMTLVHHFM